MSMLVTDKVATLYYQNNEYLLQGKLYQFSGWLSGTGFVIQLSVFTCMSFISCSSFIVQPLIVLFVCMSIILLSFFRRHTV